MSIRVIVRNGNIEYALKELKRKIVKSGIMDELQFRKFFIKPSLLKRDNLKKIKRETKQQTSKI